MSFVIPDGVILMVSPGAYVVLSSEIDDPLANTVNGIIAKTMIIEIIDEMTFVLNIKIPPCSGIKNPPLILMNHSIKSDIYGKAPSQF